MAKQTISKTVKKEAPKKVKLTKTHTEELKKEFQSYSIVDQKEILKAFGIGTEYFTCQLCGEPKRSIDIHANTDLMNKTGKAYICKKCCERIVYEIDEDGVKHNPTRESIQKVLQYLDKPYLESLYESSLNEAANTFTGKTKGDVWSAYAKNVAMPQYTGMRYSDSDIFKNSNTDLIEVQNDELPKDKEMLELYQQNKHDAIRLLGYDPFEKESLAEQPLLYANLIGYLDSTPDANEDRMRVSSTVEIVKGFNHIEKINDMITRLMNDFTNMDKNIATIRALEDTKTKITKSVLDLAKDNGISLKHSVNGSKGENTLTGMSKKLKDIDLREDEVNGFDIGTCRGMRQVADIVHASILKQINLDENDYTGMVSEQREMIVKLQEKLDEWQEKARILLRENLDLKGYLREKGLLNDDMLDSTTILTKKEEVDE